MDNCPKCNTNWIGGVIPADIAHHYSGTHYRREIGIDGGYIGVYDGLVAIQCPDCKEYFPISKHPVHKEMFNKFINYNEENK